ncbi:MAG TPA: glycosyltransferase, partial [Puia sp.]|nr:glycosyltransferase [Puia sp.]
MNRPLDFFLLIPCYNDVEGLRRSLESVEYDLTRYGVLVVDDGSDDPVTRGLPYASLPVETHVIRHDSNKGITEALNAGLGWLRRRNDYRFVARLDCGDICRPDRFIRQVDYLTRHPEIDLLGTWVRFENFDTGFCYPYRTPERQERIIRGMHFRNLFIHPSVMWRAAVLEKVAGYPGDLPYAEDYGFFCEILRHSQGAILPKELVVCRIDPEG